MPEQDGKGKRRWISAVIHNVVAVAFFAFGCLLLYFTVVAFADIKTETHGLTTTVCFGISLMCIGFAWIGSLLARKG